MCDEKLIENSTNKTFHEKLKIWMECHIKVFLLRYICWMLFKVLKNIYQTKCYQTNSIEYMNKEYKNDDDVLFDEKYKKHIFIL